MINGSSESPAADDRATPACDEDTSRASHLPLGAPLAALAFDPSPLPDYVLAARLQAGDPAALAEIYDLYGRAVYSLALRLLADPSAAEDVTHDVFLKLRRRPDQYQVQRGSLRAWLLSVAHNRSIDLLRRRRKIGRAHV